MAKKKTIKSIPIFREDQGKCMSWCLNNGIRIHIKLGEEGLENNRYGNLYRKKKTQYKILEPYEKGLVKIEIYNNGAITKSPKLYTQYEANLKIWELYCHFYDTNK